MIFAACFFITVAKASMDAAQYALSYGRLFLTAVFLPGMFKVPGVQKPQLEGTFEQIVDWLPVEACG